MDSSREETRKTTAPSIEGARQKLLFAEGLTVSALVLSGVHLMGTHQDPVQRAVVLVFAVISTLLDGTLDTLICMTVHKKASFDLDSALVWLWNGNIYWKRFPMLLFDEICGMVIGKNFEIV